MSESKITYITGEEFYEMNRDEIRKMREKKKMQGMANNGRNKHFLSDGRLVSDVCESYAHYQAVLQRIISGKSPDDAVAIPYSPRTRFF